MKVKSVLLMIGLGMLMLFLSACAGQEETVSPPICPMPL